MELQASPRIEYERRRAAKQTEVSRLLQVDDRVGSVGLWGASAAGIVFVVWLLGFISGAWILVPGAVILAARIVHLRYDARIQVLEAGLRHYDPGLARLDDRWSRHGREGPQ